MQQSGSLFTSSEARNCSAFTNGRKTTKDGSLSDFDVEPDPKVWAEVCSERGLCSAKTCGSPSDFAQGPSRLFFSARRGKVLSSDVLMLNHTLFFTLLGSVDEETDRAAFCSKMIS